MICDLVCFRCLMMLVVMEVLPVVGLLVERRRVKKIVRGRRERAG